MIPCLHLTGTAACSVCEDLADAIRLLSAFLSRIDSGFVLPARDTVDEARKFVRRQELAGR